MAKQSVAILGGRGMLGTDLEKACRDRGHDVHVVDLPEFDVTNAQHVQSAVDQADTVVNCAAYTNVDGAETERDLARRVNAEAVGRLGRIAGQADKWILHVSTDFVFDGTLDRPYRETDEPNPISEYGRSKLAGERLLAQSGCDACIVRIEWTYGRHGNNFVKKLIQAAQTRAMLRVVDDQVGSPTATTEVARAICELIQMRPTGMFHFAGSGYASRYDMAKFIFDRVKPEVEIQPCKTSEYPSPAKRPLNSRFDCTKIVGVLGRPIDPWQGPLERFLEQL